MAEYTAKLNLVKPAYDEFADIGAINGNMDKIDVAISNLDNSALTQRVTNLENNKAPKVHSSATGEYGAATTAQYGHTKLYSGIDSDSETLAATPKAVKLVAASKADKAANAIAGNMAVLTANGGIADGGLKFSINNGGLRVTYDDGE